MRPWTRLALFARPELAASDIGAKPWLTPTAGNVAAGTWSGMSNGDYVELASRLVVGRSYRLQARSSVGSGLFFFLAKNAGTNYMNAAGAVDKQFVATDPALLLYCTTAGSISVSFCSVR